MPTEKGRIIDHVGLYFVLTIKEQFVFWKEKMFPDRRQSWQFLVEAHSSGMRVSSRSTAPHYNPLRQSLRVDNSFIIVQVMNIIIKLDKNTFNSQCLIILPFLITILIEPAS